VVVLVPPVLAASVLIVDSAWTFADYVGAVFTGVVAVYLLIVALSDVLGAFCGDPLVMRVHVLDTKPETIEVRGPAFLLLLITRWVEREINVATLRALRLSSVGATIEDVEALECVSVEVTRHVKRMIVPGRDAFLVCNSLGRAVSLLSDLLDNEAAERFTRFITST
jgi:hypothetical protein